MGKKSKNKKNKQGGAGKGTTRSRNPGGTTSSDISNQIDPRSNAGYFYEHNPSENIPPEKAVELGLKYVTDDLLDAVLSRGVVVDERNLNERNNLKKYFYYMVEGMSYNPQILYQIVVSVLVGLEKGPPFINKRFNPFGGEPTPILTWACQWKLLKRNSQNTFVAGDELVDMILKAGAKVNDIVSNETNAMFFAVKYTNMMAIDSLIRAGSDMQQRDNLGRTCLNNALEHPRPILIERLLSEGLTVKELFPSHVVNENNEIIEIKQLSSSDKILSWMFQDTTKHCVSWQLLGTPSSANLGETLLLLRQKGAQFTESSSHALYFIGTFFNNNYVPPNGLQFNGKEAYKEVARYLIGTKIPDRFKPLFVEQIQQDENENKSSSGECSICLSETKRKSVTLYCGHSFCRKCILDHGQSGSGTDDRRCPLCRGALGLDITLKGTDDVSQHTSKSFQINDIMGLQGAQGAMRGPEFLDESQIISEAKFRGINRKASVSLRQKIIQDTLEGLKKGNSGSHFNLSTVDGFQGAEDRRLQYRVDLGINQTIIRDTDMFFAPKFGPCCIDVFVNGVPILARVSNVSLYTMISVKVVEQLGLQRIERLQTNKFVNILSGEKIKNQTFTCLEPITIRVGNIDVELRNAVEISPDSDNSGHEMFGVQLGSDFLASSLWCPIDVEVQTEAEGQSLFVRSTDIGGETAHILGASSKSMLRYYSHDGKTAHIPLLPFAPFKHDINYGISLRENVEFDQCFWCSRTFPRGMVVCEICHATYCDERCQSAGWKCHTRLHSD